MKRIMASQKGHKKVTKIDARDVKNLVTELDQPNVAKLLQSMSLFIQKKSFKRLLFMFMMIICN
jgi:uncharacterized protein YaaW (UPF0174 family)